MVETDTSMGTYEKKRLEYRKWWPLLEKETWINHASHSPMSIKTIEAMKRFTDGMSIAPMRPYTDWYEQQDKTRTLMAQFVNATEDEIFFNFNTSLSLSMLTRQIDWQPGDNIIVPDRTFPSIVMPAKLLTQWGVEARRVECVDGLISEDALISSIDKRTKMMIVPLVNFLTGLRLDVAKIARECRRAGVFLAVDAIQAAGPVKIDVRALGCHALCFGSPKWMFGPMGIGTCFIEREYIRKLKIPQVGMYAVKDPWNFFNYDQDFVDVAMVYECGCPAMMSHYGINPTLEMFLDIGPENIENYILKITGDFHDELTSRGVNVLTPREDSRRGAIISFDAASAGWENATELLAALDDKSVRVAERMGMIRVSPHFYNTPEELDRVLDITFNR